MTPIQSGLNGYGNDHIAINAAILANRTALLEGDYYISSSILMPYNGVNGAGKGIISNNARIYGNTENMVILHWADSKARLLGHIDLVANNQGIHLMHLTPELEENNTTVANQNYNYFQSINFLGGTEQLVIMAGKNIGGADSGCWYNRFENLYFTSGKRAIWFKDNGTTTNLVGSGSNSNSFGNVVINGSCNTGIQIDAGGGNIFSNLNMENIQLGTAPNATPTGIKVKDKMLNNGSNPNNEFYVHCENVTQKYNIQNLTTKLYDKDLVDGYSSASMTSDTGGFNLSYNCIGWHRDGNLVTVSGLVVVSSLIGSPTGRVYISLPFPVRGVTGTDYQNRVSVSVAGNLQAVTGIPVQARVLEGTNLIEIGQSGSWGSFANLIPAGSDFSFNVTYLTNY